MVPCLMSVHVILLLLVLLMMMNQEIFHSYPSTALLGLNIYPIIIDLLLKRTCSLLLLATCIAAADRPA